MLTFLVIVSHPSCRTCRSLRPYLPFPFWVSPSLIPKKCALSFHALTNCPFCNPFPFRFMHAMGGVAPCLSAPRPLCPIPHPLSLLFSDPCALFCAFLHPPNIQLPCFQSFAHSASKTPPPGVWVCGPEA